MYYRGPFLTSPLAPRPLGGMFTPSFSPRGEHSLLFKRMEGRPENFTPRGQNSSLEDNFAHGELNIIIYICSLV
jgi:hypothetical protein